MHGGHWPLKPETVDFSSVFTRLLDNITLVLFGKRTFDANLVTY